MKVTEAHRREIEERAAYLKALSSPVRLCMLYRMKEEGELCVSDFCECMEASQPLISKHLLHMKSLGLISSRQEGTKVFYRIEDEKLPRILTYLEEAI